MSFFHEYMAMMGVVRKVVRVVCSAIGEAPREATADRVLQKAVQVREARLFEPGFHGPNRIQCSPVLLILPTIWFLWLSSHCWIRFAPHALPKLFQLRLLLLLRCCIESMSFLSYSSGSKKLEQKDPNSHSSIFVKFL